MDQKTQLQIIEKFKAGTYNTIVATSIGEEGLDIGEVDLIVCYDSSASPIRMLQRMGRTGRKRAGNITLLLMKGKEEESYIKAKDNYEKMQEMIASGARFTFHDDRSARILPAGIRPTPDKRHIDIPPENSQRGLPEPKRRGKAPKRPPKKFHMPDDVETGFTRASDIGADSSRKKTKAATPKKRPRTPSPEPVEIPSLEEVFLNPTEQKELEHHYQNIGATSPQFIRFPRNDAFPRLQLDARPTKIVKHGSLTRRMIAALRKMDETSLDCDDHFKQILEQAPLSFSETEHASIGDSSVSPKPHRQKASKTVPAPSSHTLGVTAPNADETDDADVLALLSADTLDHSRKSKQHAPLLDDAFDDDLDFDLPDPSFLFSSSSKPKPARKQKRPVIEDSDE
jgi:ATP-dependent DNA helicase MPH1